MSQALAVFDIGKTNIKLSLVDHEGRELAVRRRANQVVHAGLYPHHDVAAIETWLLQQLRELSGLAQITAIVPVTHGATAVLVDEHGPVLPVTDYEQDFSVAAGPAYAQLRPHFAESFSPALDHGLNLGQQLYWLQQTYPQQFARARHLLMYPQYWSWRLSGVAAAELTSLGCHTDLWQFEGATYSSLVRQRGWQHLMPPLAPAWQVLGTLHPALAQQTGLAADCQILCGVHDSNASLLRYLKGGAQSPRLVLSTGTWVIAAALDGQLQHLQEQGDMLANVSVLGEAVPCMRFMGGREFAELAGAAPQECSVAELQALVTAGVMALPCFADCGGPFAGRHGSVRGGMPATASGRYALATLYCVLMTDYCLQRLGADQADTALVVEGSFTANPHFAGVLAAIGSGRTVYCSQDGSGTTVGAWMLRHWQCAEPPLASAPALVAPVRLDGWEAYRNAWRAALR